MDSLDQSTADPILVSVVAMILLAPITVWLWKRIAGEVRKSSMNGTPVRLGRIGVFAAAVTGLMIWIVLLAGNADHPELSALETAAWIAARAITAMCLHAFLVLTVIVMIYTDPRRGRLGILMGRLFMDGKQHR